MRFVIFILGWLLSACNGIAADECNSGQPYSLSQIATQNRAILVGELHGTEEMPAEFLRIVEELTGQRSNIVVAVEYPALWQDQLDNILASENAVALKERFDRLSTGDGRTSEAMESLMEGLWVLRKQNKNLFVVGVDYWKKDYPDDDLSIPDWIPDEVEAENSIRDIRMGQNVVAACEHRDCDLLLYYAGNFHTKTVMSMGGSLNPETGEILRFPVMPSGAVIAHSFPTASIFLSHRGGDITANVDGEFGRRVRKPNAPDYVIDDHIPYCAATSDLAYDYNISVGTISSSVDQSDEDSDLR